MRAEYTLFSKSVIWLTRAIISKFSKPVMVYWSAYKLEYNLKLVARKVFFKRNFN
jgi:hypothetical protein